jgi:RNA-binding protein YlmH
MRTDAQLEAGALLSAAGLGRVQLRSVDGMTKKQRIGVTFFKYQ